MFKRIKEFFFGKPAAPVEPVAPYKVEAQTYVVDQGMVVTIPAFKPTADAAPVVEAPVVEAAPTPKTPNTRKPRANVAAKKIAAAKKPAAKKPAAPKKPTV